MFTNRNAFSLIELSIVVVIIGLLFVGLSGARKIIESSKISKLMVAINSLDSSIVAFNHSYDALPGDFNDALAYFGSNVRNGDGDRMVEYKEEASRSNSFGDEVSNVMLHLSLAEFIDDSYNSRIDELDYYYDKLPFNSYLLYLNSYSELSSSNNNFNSFFQNNISNIYSKQINLFVIGNVKINSRSTGLSGLESENMISNSQAYLFDKKFDDGDQNYGRITMKFDNSTPITCSYNNFNSEDQNCIIIYEPNM